MFAIYDGRFQPWHIGHMAFVERIHVETGLPVVIMVIHSTLSRTTEGYSSIADEHHRPKKNPLSVWERVTLIRSAVDHAKFDFVTDILAIPRPDLHWDLARGFYPADRVICLSGKDEYERRKEAFWAECGEQTRIISTEGLPKISATDIKRKMRLGEDWSDLIPLGAQDYLRAIDGLQRIAAAS